MSTEKVWDDEARRTRIAVREALKMYANVWLANTNWAWVDMQYPAPPPLTRTVPREVVDPHDAYRRWRVCNERMETREDGFAEWLPPSAQWFTGVKHATPERWNLWAGLFANPTRTEPVDDE